MLDEEAKASLMHLARRWEAHAAEMERRGLEGGHLARAEVRRECAQDLKTVLMELSGGLP